jgi:hypothetical protein
MKRQEITRQIKLATLITLSKIFELAGKFCLKANTFFFKCDIWCTAKSAKYRRVFL